MDRYKMEDLKKWKNSTNRKPLIIRGARQVGKHGWCKNLEENIMKNVLI